MTATEALPKPNLRLLRKVLNHIDKHPESYYQGAWATRWGSWVRQSQRYRWVSYMDRKTKKVRRRKATMCTTSYCFAGHAIVQAGHDFRTMGLHDDLEIDGRHTSIYRVIDKARELLGLTQEEANALFEGDNTRRDVQDVCEQIWRRAGKTLIL